MANRTWLMADGEWLNAASFRFDGRLADDKRDRAPQPERAGQASLGRVHWSASLPSNLNEATLSHSPSAISHVLFAICSPRWYDAAPCFPRRDPARDGALDAALERIGWPRPVDRPDTPDLHVTAVRRLPAVAAQFAPFPEALDARLTQALDVARHRAALHASGRGDRARAGRPHTSSSSRRPRRARRSATTRRCCTRSCRIRRAARCISFRPRRSRRISSPSCRRCARRSTRRTGEQIGVFTYDGDTPQDARRTIRSRAHLVLSNPDMVHSGILPHHPRWAKLFENLRYVDHRRAARLSRRVRQPPVQRAAAAAPHLPALRIESGVPLLVGDDCRTRASWPSGSPSSRSSWSSESGAPRGEKFFVFVNPPVVNQQLGIRRSYLGETRRIASEFLKRNLQLIVFAQSRLSTEILTTYLKDDFEGVPGAPERIRGYRGGYLPLRRREIEKGLREGAVRAVVSTNALELGIDIGALDVSVMAGYPGTIAATWQRAGRAGRRAGRSAAVMVASSAPLDQFVVRNPSYFFDASPERALIDPDNLHILVDHIKCAAFELPFTRERDVRPPRRAGDPRRPGRAGAGAPGGGRRTVRTPVDLDQRVVSGRRGQPALGVVGQLRRRRHDARDARHRRDRFHQRPVHAAPEGDLHRRRAAVSGGAARLRGAQGVRARDRLRLLHDRDHLHAASTVHRHVRRREPAPARRTAKSTSSRGWSASRRSSSTRTRTSARASSICPSSRCTRRRTG